MTLAWFFTDMKVLSVVQVVVLGYCHDLHNLHFLHDLHILRKPDRPVSVTAIAWAMYPCP